MITALAENFHAHLFRLALWSALSALVAIYALARDRKSGFGAMTLGWAAINGLIIALGWNHPPADFDSFRSGMIVAIAMNVVWIAIGVVMARKRGMATAEANQWVNDAGRAMTIQAVVLMGLDLYYMNAPIVIR